MIALLVFAALAGLALTAGPGQLSGHCRGHSLQPAKRTSVCYT
jgi:hypothetical protein